MEAERYLNRAKIALQLDNVIKDSDDKLLDNYLSLRETISKLFNITKNITFRQNATQAFKDILILTFYYNHKNEFADNNKVAYRLFITDIDHPVMIQMAKTILPEKNIIFTEYADFFFNHPGLTQKTACDYFIEKIISEKITVALIPQVNWINGSFLDVNYICKELKRHTPSIITIVDGAQALGNIKVIIDNEKENEDIDFYIGSGHKWMGSPIPVGFARVSEKFLANREQCINYLFISDYFSSFAGNIEYLYKLDLDTYNLQFSNMFNKVVNKLFYEENLDTHFKAIIDNIKPIRDIFTRNNQLNFITGPENSDTGFFAVTGEKNYLHSLSGNLDEEDFKHSLTAVIISGKKLPFIRISSPFQPLGEKSLNTLTNIVLCEKSNLCIS